MSSQSSPPEPPAWLRRQAERFCSIGYEAPEDELWRQATIQEGTIFNAISKLKSDASEFVELYDEVAKVRTSSTRFFDFLMDVIEDLPVDRSELNTAQMDRLVVALEKRCRSYRATSEKLGVDSIEIFETVNCSASKLAPLIAVWESNVPPSEEVESDADSGASVAGSDDDALDSGSESLDPIPSEPKPPSPGPVATPSGVIPRTETTFTFKPSLSDLIATSNPDDRTMAIPQVAIPGGQPWPGYEVPQGRLSSLHRPFQLTVEGESPDLPFEVSFIPDDPNLLPIMYRVDEKVTPHPRHTQVLREHLELSKNVGAYRERSEREIGLGLYPEVLLTLVEEREKHENVLKKLRKEKNRQRSDGANQTSPKKAGNLLPRSRPTNPAPRPANHRPSPTLSTDLPPHPRAAASASHPPQRPQASNSSVRDVRQSGRTPQVISSSVDEGELQPFRSVSDVIFPSNPIPAPTPVADDDDGLLPFRSVNDVIFPSNPIPPVADGDDGLLPFRSVDDVIFPSNPTPGLRHPSSAETRTPRSIPAPFKASNTPPAPSPLFPTGGTTQNTPSSSAVVHNPSRPRATDIDGAQVTISTVSSPNKRKRGADDDDTDSEGSPRPKVQRRNSTGILRRGIRELGQYLPF